MSQPLSTVTKPVEITDGHVEAFNALAHPTRLRVFAVLARAGGELSAGAIQRAVGTSAPTLSHHLAVLRRAGLVRSRRQQRHIYYSVDRDEVIELVRLLTNCC